MPQPEDRLTLDALRLDPEEAVDEIVERLGEVVSRNLRKRGALVGVSGGIDSSVTAALCVRALGPGKVMVDRLLTRGRGSRARLPQGLPILHFAKRFAARARVGQ